MQMCYAPFKRTIRFNTEGGDGCEKKKLVQ